MYLSYIYDGGLTCLRCKFHSMVVQICVLLHTHAIYLLLIAVPSVPQNCYADGHYELIDVLILSFPPNFRYTSGTVEICVNETFYRVCANDTHASLDSTTPSLICSSLGYGTCKLNISFLV